MRNKQRYDRLANLLGQAVYTRRYKTAIRLTLWLQELDNSPDWQEVRKNLAARDLLDTVQAEGETAPYWRKHGHIHGVTPAPEGKKWVRNIMSDCWILEDESTPFTCSVASETYWCS